MDDARFDALAKRMAGGISRRGVLRGLAGLAGAGVIARVGRGGAEAADCASRCDRLPAGASRDQCNAACTTADETRARGVALRACGGDESRLCGDGVEVACCGPDETCQYGACVASPVDCEPIGGACSTGGECCAPNVCADGACVGSCPPGYRLCDGVCYAGGCCADADCGGACLTCGTDHACHACEDVGMICQNGSCVTEPAQCGSANCSGCCDASGNCRPGTSGASCGINGEVCVDCPGAQSCCGGACTDVQTDPAHCGGCTTACDSGQTCQSGSCVKPPPQCDSTNCSGCCDPNGNCRPGTSGASCGTNGAACVDCPNGDTCCGGACANIINDPAHCGACDTPCAPGQVCDRRICCTPIECQPGQCGSPPDGCGGTLNCGGCGTGETCCGGTCADLEFDPAHCGTCGHACPSGQACCNGACTEPCFEAPHGCCAAGESCCGVNCCATGHCCGAICCEEGESCCNDSCCATGHCCGGAECCADANACCEAEGVCCPAGQICCGDGCTALDDRDNCGTCDNTCAPNQVCLGVGGCCTPGTCEGRCGTISDGCLSTLECGDCPTGECLTCDNTDTCVTTCTTGQVCHEATCCTLKTCAELPKLCGDLSDGCGGTVNCSCGLGQECVNNGCFNAGNSDMCTEGTTKNCPCNSGEDCCECDRGFDGTSSYLCWRAEPEPAQIDCPKGNVDCPQGWVCQPATNPVENSFCAPPC